MKRKPFELYELEAYLGTPEEFDVGTIIDRVTCWDDDACKQYWRNDISAILDDVCMAHHKDYDPGIYFFTASKRNAFVERLASELDATIRLWHVDCHAVVEAFHPPLTVSEWVSLNRMCNYMGGRVSDYDFDTNTVTIHVHCHE